MRSEPRKDSSLHINMRHLRHHWILNPHSNPYLSRCSINYIINAYHNTHLFIVNNGLITQGIIIIINVNPNPNRRKRTLQYSGDFRTDNCINLPHLDTRRTFQLTEGYCCGLGWRTKLHFSTTNCNPQKWDLVVGSAATLNQKIVFVVDHQQLFVIQPKQGKYGPT